MKKEADEALSSYSQSNTGNRSPSRISFKDRGMRAVLRIGAGSNQDNILSPESKKHSNIRANASDHEIHASMSSMQDPNLGTIGNGDLSARNSATGDAQGPSANVAPMEIFGRHG